MWIHAGFQGGFSPASRTLNPALSIPYSDSFLARFDPSGSTLLFATYLGSANQAVNGRFGRALSVATDGSAYLVASQGVFRINAAGSALLGSFPTQPLSPQVLTLAPDGSVYVAGIAGARFPATPGAFGEHPGQARFDPVNAAL